MHRPTDGGHKDARIQATFLLKDLQGEAQEEARQAARRFQRHPYMRDKSVEQILAERQQIQRKHALEVVALEWGYESWRDFAAGKRPRADLRSAVSGLPETSGLVISSRAEIEDITTAQVPDDLRFRIEDHPGPWIPFVMRGEEGEVVVRFSQTVAWLGTSLNEHILSHFDHWAKAAQRHPACSFDGYDQRSRVENGQRLQDSLIVFRVHTRQRHLGAGYRAACEVLAELESAAHAEERSAMAVRAEAEVPHVAVEYNLTYTGGEYGMEYEFAGNGELTYIPAHRALRISEDELDELFELHTGIDSRHIVSWLWDQGFFTAAGEQWDEAALGSAHYAIERLRGEERLADAGEGRPTERVVPAAGPRVGAVMRDDGDHYRVEFDATPFFEEASDEEILALARVGWGGDYEADAVVYHVAPQNADVAALLRMVESRNETEPEGYGFECDVDEDDAHAWLAEHRPKLVQQILARRFMPRPEA